METTIEPQKIRFDNLDLLKMIAIFCVVWYHGNNLPTNFLTLSTTSTYIHYILVSFISTCVPIFFFVHGALILNKPELDLKKHIKKIFWFISLTIVWGITTIVALSLIRHQPITLSNTLSMLWHLQQGWINHLWFLQAFVVLYIFLPFLHITFHQHRGYFWFFSICLFLLTFGNTLVSQTVTVLSALFHTHTTAQFSLNWFSGFNAFAGIRGYTIAYAVLGGILFQYKKTIRMWLNTRTCVVILLISMALLSGYGYIETVRTGVLWDQIWYGYDSIMTLAMTVALYALSLTYRHSGFTGRILQQVSTNSLGIYLIHTIVIAICLPLFKSTSFSTTLIANLLFTTLMVGCSLLVVFVLKKIVFIRTLV